MESTPTHDDTPAQRPMDAAGEEEQQQDVECNICYNPALENRRCKSCRHLFCHTCIHEWMEKSAIPTCPTCRCDLGDTTLEHDEEVQNIVDKRETCCDICGTTVTYKSLAKHRLLCMNEEIQCPFAGCSFHGTRSAMDIHTASCCLGANYNLEEVIQSVCKRAADSQPQFVNEHLLEDIYQPDDTNDSDTLVHFVQAHDTLSGLAVKYSCTREEILRLNNLTYEAHLFARASIIVPRPESWRPKEEPEVPLSVLVALRKKKLTRRVVTKCSVPEPEAVAYLHLTHYKADEAIRLIEEDVVWSLQHGESQPKSLKEFLGRKQRGLAPCTGCDMPIAQHTPRQHCAACGAFFCHRCHHGQGQCKLTVPKLALGVTNPDARYQHVRVCHGCHDRLSPPSTTTAPAAQYTPPSLQYHQRAQQQHHHHHHQASAPLCS
ncbi:hypothetical protein PTSG_08256 [Salpingoeca rosetta]|uniref:RING-type domain-containing protein n=1 Tax=Salpingoeca rosetta (strain ATCC 50818 / BSB-021) TaxID=946362 RepID=F2UIG2_SALR5|nr:uncharacterized protein PTSG_08256 [Salpingoeca rosetta]EGD76911.1 hypothetical protein PTSG_08256 [Salpingoeca rosetta]|eukprot:XP_004991282.1 hypothetical protein PTSG_08256 [Salpingoeca rosetta]